VGGGIGRRRDRPHHFRTTRFQQALQSCADRPRIFDDQNAQTIEVRSPRSEQSISVR
jgi:hypothetical protein